MGMHGSKWLYHNKFNIPFSWFFHIYLFIPINRKSPTCGEEFKAPKINFQQIICLVAFYWSKVSRTQHFCFCQNNNMMFINTDSGLTNPVTLYVWILQSLATRKRKGPWISNSSNTRKPIQHSEPQNSNQTTNSEYTYSRKIPKLTRWVHWILGSYTSVSQLSMTAISKILSIFESQFIWNSSTIFYEPSNVVCINKRQF